MSPCKTQTFVDIPLADLFAEANLERSPKPKPPAAPRAVARGNCPCCSATSAALVRTGEHLTWREHTYTTWSGARLACQASGAPVCGAPEKHALDGRWGPVLCGHDVPKSAQLRTYEGKVAGRALEQGRGWTP